MSYVRLADLDNKDWLSLPMSKAEFDHMSKLEAAGVPHEIAKRMIYEARPNLPPIPGVAVAVAKPVAGVADKIGSFLTWKVVLGGLGVAFGAGLISGYRRRQARRAEFERMLRGETPTSLDLAP